MKNEKTIEKPDDEGSYQRSRENDTTNKETECSKTFGRWMYGFIGLVGEAESTVTACEGMFVWSSSSLFFLASGQETGTHLFITPNYYSCILTRVS